MKDANIIDECINTIILNLRKKIESMPKNSIYFSAALVTVSHDLPPSLTDALLKLFAEHIDICEISPASAAVMRIKLACDAVGGNILVDELIGDYTLISAMDMNRDLSIAIEFLAGIATVMKDIAQSHQR